MGTEVERFDYDLIISEMASPQAHSNAIAEFAREQLAELTLDKAIRYVQIVDGVVGAVLERVKPNGGEIVFEFEPGLEVLEYIQDMLVQISPMLSGEYSSSHVMLADGAEVQFGAEIPRAAVYQFVNTTPYARKIEAGSSSQARDGVYHVVSTMAERRYGNQAKIEFGNIRYEDQYQPAISVRLY